MSDELKASEVLDRAADEMMIRGRGTGYLLHSLTGKVCAVGALALANGLSQEDLNHAVDIDPYIEVNEKPGTAEFSRYIGKTYPEFVSSRAWQSGVVLIYNANDDNIIDEEDFRIAAKELREEGR